MVSTLEFLLHELTSVVGDIAYADSWVKEENAGYIKPLNLTDGGKEYDHILNDFYDEVAPLSQDLPYMVAAGETGHFKFRMLADQQRQPRSQLRQWL
jgi:hypothetical protein